MAKNLTKREDLQEDLRHAVYLLQDATLKSSDKWMTEQVRQYDVAVGELKKKLEEKRQEHNKATSQIIRLKADVEMRERLLAEHVNRGTINKAEEVATKIQELIARLKAMGLSDEQITKMTGG